MEIVLNQILSAQFAHYHDTHIIQTGATHRELQVCHKTAKCDVILSTDVFFINMCTSHGQFHLFSWFKIDCTSYNFINK